MSCYLPEAGESTKTPHTGRDPLASSPEQSRHVKYVCQMVEGLLPGKSPWKTLAG